MNKVELENQVRTLEERLLVTLSDQSLGLSALTHKSYSNEHPGEGAADNERLEFLGDAVIGLAISHWLMKRLPQATEGELSRLRALIVNEEALARVARQIGLGDLLLLGRGEELTGGRYKDSVLADALEAVFGAIFLGNGWQKVMELVDRHFTEALEGAAAGRSGLDYKSLLQEAIQSRLRLSPKYRVISEAGPDHEKTFEVEVAVTPELTARGFGRSKKEAEQAAARALSQLMSAGEK